MAETRREVLKGEQLDGVLSGLEDSSGVEGASLVLSPGSSLHHHLFLQGTWVSPSAHLILGVAHDRVIPPPTERALALQPPVHRPRYSVIQKQTLAERAPHSI